MLKRLPELDGVRAIAVLFVFFSHTSGRDMSLHPSLNFAGIGHVGVYLFFCLSAFLISMRLFTEEFNAKSVKRFYTKRIFRILPLYYSVVIVVFSWQLISQQYDEHYLFVSHGWTGFFQHLFMYRGDGVFWSVVAEEQFYILVPLWVYLLLRFRWAAFVMFAGVALLNGVLYMCKNIHWPLHIDWIKYITTNDRTSGNYLDIFITGITFVWIFVSYRPFFDKNKKVIIAVANILFISVSLLTLILVSESFLWFRQPFYDFRFLSLMYAFVFSLFLISVYLGNPLNRILQWKWLCYIGLIGFSVYLLHMPVFAFVNTYFDLPSWARFFISSCLLLAVASLTYYFIEKPFIRISYQLINKFKWN